MPKHEEEETEVGFLIYDSFRKSSGNSNSDKYIFFMQSEIWLIEEVCPDQNHDSFWLAMLIWQLPPEQEFMVISY